MRALKGSTKPSAALAIDHFVYNISKFAGALTAVLGGLDAFVFTAGIAENDARGGGWKACMARRQTRQTSE